MQRLWLLSRMKLKKALPLVKSGCDRFDPRGSIEALLAVLFGRSSRCFLGDPRGAFWAILAVSWVPGVVIWSGFS